MNDIEVRDPAQLDLAARGPVFGRDDQFTLRGKNDAAPIGEPNRIRAPKTGPIRLCDRP